MNCVIREKGKKAAELFLDALFPPGIYCICCGSLTDGSRAYSLCDECIKKLHWINGRACEKCGKALQDTYRGSRCGDCMTYTHSFERGYSCLAYGMYERQLIFDFKYNGKRYLARHFGDILYDRIILENINPDVIMPIPVHKSREKRRGYNQAALMAKRLAVRMNVPFDGKSLYRKKQTGQLRGLAPAEREAVLEGAFDVKGKGCRAKSVLLIDDIYTTGATADACSRILYACGAKNVYLLTLASGGNSLPEQRRKQ